MLSYLRSKLSHIQMGVLILRLLLASLCIQPLYASSPLTSYTGDSEDSVALPETLDKAELNALLASMDDAQVRRILLQKLDEELVAREKAKKEQLERTSMMGESSLFSVMQIQLFAESISANVKDLFTAISNWDQEFDHALLLLTDDQGIPALFRGVWIGFLMFLGGLLVERILCGYYLRKIRQRIDQQVGQGIAFALSISAMQLLFRIISILTFALVAYGISFYFFARFDPLRFFISSNLFILVKLMSIRAIALFLLAPHAPSCRLFRLCDATSRSLYLWILCLSGVILFARHYGDILSVLGFSLQMMQLFYLLNGIVMVILLECIVLKFHRFFTHELIAGSNLEKFHPVLCQLIVKSWHIMIGLFILLLGMAWMLTIIASDIDRARSVVYALLAISLIPLIDRMMLLLIEIIANTRKTQPQASSAATGVVLDRNLRIALWFVLMVISGFFFLDSIGFGLVNLLQTPEGATVLQVVMNVFVTLIIAYVIWVLIKTAIDRHLPEADKFSAPSLKIDGEGGEGPAATRSETLLPLVRNTISFFIFVVALMFVLHAIGIDIAPLLAGAGVLGIAIGFGAQRLVEDVIAGLFFLIDDAFRVGEYVEIHDLSGSVEEISVRSMKLRHHLGPMQTIPYGTIQSIKNHSRDFIIMKLPFRVPFATDIEKVRKIIKKTGQEMLQHPEYGEHFLAPLKSQGVIEMDDSAMVMRMKFTCVPGEQWVIRREAYRLVSLALQAQGIHFAHRSVTVHVPGVTDPETREKVAAAAAEEVVASTNESARENQSKLDKR